METNIITVEEKNILQDYKYNLRAVLEEAIDKRIKAKIQNEMAAIEAFLNKVYQHVYHKKYKNKCFQYPITNIGFR